MKEIEQWCASLRRKWPIQVPYLLPIAETSLDRLKQVRQGNKKKVKEPVDIVWSPVSDSRLLYMRKDGTLAWKELEQVDAEKSATVVLEQKEGESEEVNHIVHTLGILDDTEREHHNLGTTNRDRWFWFLQQWDTRVEGYELKTPHPRRCFERRMARWMMTESTWKPSPWALSIELANVTAELYDQFFGGNVPQENDDSVSYDQRVLTCHAPSFWTLTHAASEKTIENIARDKTTRSFEAFRLRMLNLICENRLGPRLANPLNRCEIVDTAPEFTGVVGAVVLMAMDDEADDDDTWIEWGGGEKSEFYKLKVGTAVILQPSKLGLVRIHSHGRLLSMRTVF